MEDYMTIKEATERWNVSVRWVQTLCSEGKIKGAIKFGNVWAIPLSAEKPPDKRVTSGEYRNWRKK